MSGRSPTVFQCKCKVPGCAFSACWRLVSGYARERRLRARAIARAAAGASPSSGGAGASPDDFDGGASSGKGMSMFGGGRDDAGGSGGRWVEIACVAIGELGQIASWLVSTCGV
jgi:hypothetical protein